MSFAVPPPFRAISSKLINATLSTVNSLTSVSQLFPFPEAKVGDAVMITVISADPLLNFSGFVDSDGRITIQVANPSATNTSMANANYRVIVFHF